MSSAPQSSKRVRRWRTTDFIPLQACASIRSGPFGPHADGKCARYLQFQGFLRHYTRKKPLIIAYSRPEAGPQFMVEIPRRARYNYLIDSLTARGKNQTHERQHLHQGREGEQPQEHRPGDSARQTCRVHRPFRLRKELARVRHDIRRGPAALRGEPVQLCAHVPRADGQAPPP